VSLPLSLLICLPSHPNLSLENLLKGDVLSASDEQPQQKYQKRDSEDSSADRRRFVYLKYYRDGQIRILEELCQELAEILEQRDGEEGEEEEL
jgi:hypothetical protein